MGYSLSSNVTFLNQHPTFPFDSRHLLFALGGILLIMAASPYQGGWSSSADCGGIGFQSDFSSQYMS